MAVWALGINHTTAPLDLRGRFAFAIDQIEPTLRGLRESLSRKPEAALVSTCNRTEIYCAGEKPELEHTLDWLAHCRGVSSSLLRSHAYTLEDVGKVFSITRERVRQIENKALRALQHPLRARHLASFVERPIAAPLVCLESVSGVAAEAENA